MGAPIFTIGHSTHSIDMFMGLLKMHDILAVCDVRSSPYSRFNPQFNREALRDSLRDQGTSYVFLGKELGARSKDPSCYQNGKVQYDLLANTDLFRRGLDRILSGSETFRVALMCAEKDPLHCHRMILVARHIVAQGVSVNHILSDGTIETHEKSVERLLNSLKISSADLFRSKEEIVCDAYRIQGDAIAYSEKSEETRKTF